MAARGKGDMSILAWAEFRVIWHGHKHILELFYAFCAIGRLNAKIFVSLQPAFAVRNRELFCWFGRIDRNLYALFNQKR